METIYDGWAEIYDGVYSYVTEDIPFYVQASIQAQGSVLELGCGTGRVTLPIAQAGVDITGLDSSRCMLGVAQRKIIEADKFSGQLALLQNDMRGFTLNREFELIIIPFRGFLSMLTVEHQIDLLNNIKLHLSPGGRLVFNVFVPDLEMLVQQGDVPYHFRDVIDPQNGTHYVLWHQSWYDNFNQIIDVRVTIEELDSSMTVIRKIYRDFPLRYAHRWEIHHLLENQGFHIVDLHGDFDGSEFNDKSGEMIWVAEKV